MTSRISTFLPPFHIHIDTSSTCLPFLNHHSVTISDGPQNLTICCHLNKSALRHILPKFEQHCIFRFHSCIHGLRLHDHGTRLKFRGVRQLKSLQHGKLESLSLGCRIFIFRELYNSHTAQFFIFLSLENLAETRS